MKLAIETLHMFIFYTGFLFPKCYNYNKKMYAQ